MSSESLSGKTVWKDTYKFSVGVHYQPVQEWLFQLGFAKHLFSLDILGLFAGLLLLTALSGTVIWLIEHRRNREMFGGRSVHGIGHSMWWAMVTILY